MTTIFLYIGSARYRGTPAFDWACPTVGASHKFILFLGQADDSSNSHLADMELERYGFADIALEDARPIVPESLNDPRMQAFCKHYEEALEEGSSLVWYP